MKIDWQFLLVASFGVTGIIQWVKGIVRDPKNPWSYVSPVLSLGMGIILNGGWQGIVMNTVLVLSISQLGYDVLVKPIKKLLGVSEEDTTPGVSPGGSGGSVIETKDSDGGIDDGQAITKP